MWVRCRELCIELLMKEGKGDTFEMKDMKNELDRIERIGRAKKKKQDLERRINEREVRLQTERRKET